MKLMKFQETTIAVHSYAPCFLSLCVSTLHPKYYFKTYEKGVELNLPDFNVNISLLFEA